MMLDQSHDPKNIGHNITGLLLWEKEYPSLRNITLLEQEIRIFFTLIFFFFHLFSQVIHCVIFLTCNLVGMIVPKVLLKVEY